MSGYDRYDRVHTQPRDIGDGVDTFGVAGSDELWECPSCSAVVKDRELHDRWHSLSRIGLGGPLF